MLRGIVYVVLMALGLVHVGVAIAEMQAPNRNWMRSYVEERKLQMAVRLGGEAESLHAVGRIVGGKPARLQDNPFTVALLFKYEPDDYFAQYCAGTLIKPDVVVTAAHCSDFADARDVQVLVRTQSLDGSGKRVNVDRIIVHPNFEPRTFDFDVAVWHLKREENRMQTARLASKDGPAERLLLATGWGDLGDGYFPVDLRAVQLPLISRTDCREAWGDEFTSRMLCAGDLAGGVGPCFADSGGPLARGNRLIGIISWGPASCALRGLPGVYTRITSPRVRKFIREND